MFLQPNTFEHTHCHCSSYLRIRSTFTGILREKKILLTPSYSVTTINYVSVAKLWNADTDRTCKFLHNSNTEGLVFKIVWGFFDIVICCFAIFQSSLLNKILLISKNRIPSHRFFIVWYLGSILTKFQGNSWNFHALLISSKKVRLQKNEIVFCIQSFRGVTTCG